MIIYIQAFLWLLQALKVQQVLVHPRKSVVLL